jgi:hypothetical protein
MRLHPFLKELPIPAILSAGIYAGITGDLPLVGGSMDLQLINLDMLVFENKNHPALFLVFSGLTIGWLVYLVSKLIIYGRRESALVQLGEVWEEGTSFRNDAMQRAVLSADDLATIKRFEDKILNSVGAVSKPELSFFRKINTFNPGDHPPEVHPGVRGDKILVIFSERLRRVGEFIKKYTGEK